MPRWLGDLFASALTAVAPRGFDFARYSIDYHYLRNHLYTRSEWGHKRAAEHTPHYVQRLVKKYGGGEAGGWLALLEAEVDREAMQKKMRR